MNGTILERNLNIGNRVQIALMTSADIPAVMEIERSSHLEPWSRESFLEELQRSHSRVLLARISEDLPCASGCHGTHSRPPGNVAGYVCFWMVADEIQILNVAVHKDCRRRGVARQLLVHALKMGVERGARVAVLEVRKSNTTAQALYGSLGFRQAGERPDYYGIVKEPAIFMELDFDGICALAMC